MITQDPRSEENNLRDALAEAPRGALALGAIAVALLIAAWFAVYLLIFLPRGTVT